MEELVALLDSGEGTRDEPDHLAFIWEVLDAREREAQRQDWKLENLRHLALDGLRAAGPLATDLAPRFTKVVRESEDARLALEAATVLATMGGEHLLTAMDLWLELEPWPVRHHGSLLEVQQLSGIFASALGLLLAQRPPHSAELAFTLGTLYHLEAPAQAALRDARGDEDEALCEAAREALRKHGIKP